MAKPNFTEHIGEGHVYMRLHFVPWPELNHFVSEQTYRDFKAWVRENVQRIREGGRVCIRPRS